LINAGKDVFFSVLAHDLKNPIGGLLGLSRELVDIMPADTNEVVREMATVIRDTSSQVGDLLFDLLSWAQMQVGKLAPAPEKVSILKEVEFAVALVGVAARAKKIEIVNEITEPIEIYCDVRMNDTVLRNLLSNAVKFTPPGGKIRVMAEKREGELVITVADSGKGIPSDRIAGLFRLGENKTTFGTAGEKGTGLGLPLSQDMVGKNGGRIWVESTPGEGSLFHFTVPLAK
jgi:signal transduction histidine kinase